MIRSLSRRILPRSLRRRLVRLTRWPPVGVVKFENLRRLEPVSRSWGGDRGLPIDRYYIERFLEANRADIRGHVMEIGDRLYTERYGGEAVVKSDVLDNASGPNVTLVSDLARATDLDGEQFDCIICTQTVHLIPDLDATIVGLYHLLKPGGVLLITGPAAAPVGQYQDQDWNEYWRFTAAGLRWLLSRSFASDKVQVRAYGNVLTTVAFFHGLASEELRSDELDYVDPQFELLVAARAAR